MILWLQALGRPVLCSCGILRLWGPHHDSQHLSDWYSLLHLSFGLALYVLIARFQPRWPMSLQAVVALFGSVTWEAVENLPAVIAMFNAGGSQDYSGDTILNALGDTAFVLAGCLLAARLSTRAIVSVAAAIEATTWLAINDSIVVGAARLLAGT